MPFKSVKELPKYLNKYSPKIRRQWMYVFNTVYAKTRSESRSFRAANSVLKKRFKVKKSMERNTRQDYISMLIDSFLGNIKG